MKKKINYNIDLAPIYILVMFITICIGWLIGMVNNWVFGIISSILLIIMIV